MRLSELTPGRDNNLNLVRLVASLAVLVTHGFAITVGTPKAEPFVDSLGMTIGTIAVDVFFVISGLLVTASLFSGKGLIEFFWSRVLRIFPALWVMLGLTVLVLGPLLTTFSLTSYLESADLHRYIVRCGTLLFGVSYQLPGVFNSNPYPNAVNGSLWSMPYELRMYTTLAVAWIILSGFRTKRPLVMGRAILLYTAVAGAVLITLGFRSVESGHFLRLSYMFFAGSCAHLLQSRIEISWKFFVGILITLISLTAINGRDGLLVPYIIGLPYLVIFLAYTPSKIARIYNRAGDFSYGIYIYAFPIQQTIAAVFKGINIAENIGLATILCLLVGSSSWYLLERKALKAKPAMVAWSRRILATVNRVSC